jgi:electron transport complex protein RnfG
MTHAHGVPAAAAPQPPDVSPWRLIGTLAFAGAVAGFLIVVAFALTQPTIQRNKAIRLAAAVEEVLEAPERYDTLYVVNGALTPDLPAGADPATLDRIYEGFDGDGRRAGFAIPAGEPGFQDVINLIFGYDPATRQLLGMKVLESKETPGLGSKIESDSAFVAQFSGPETPLVGVKAGRSTGAETEVDLITGATISSTAVVRIINDALARFQPMLDGYLSASASRAP